MSGTGGDDDPNEKLLDSAVRFKKLLNDDEEEYGNDENVFFSSSEEGSGAEYDDDDDEYIDGGDGKPADAEYMRDNDVEDDKLVQRLEKNIDMDGYDESDMEDEGNFDIELADAFKEDMDMEDPDEEFDINSSSFRNALRGAAGMKGRRSRKSVGRGLLKRLDPEVRMKMSLANEAFVSNDINQAQKLYMEVITLDPKNYAALKTLGEIAKMKGKLASCCVYWILAAQINSWDGEFWATVGDLSDSLGHHRQAFYCYSHAVRHDTKDHKYLWARTELYARRNELFKATTGYQRLLSYYPTNQQIVIELAKLYSEQNRLSDAVSMYLNILNKNIEYYSHENGAKKTFPDFEWSELNILGELLYKQGSFVTGLAILKQTARWLQGRSDETFWDAKQDDGEFDDRRTTNEEFKKLTKSEQERPHLLPIDIRIKFGLFRLRLDHFDEAVRHFDFLLKEPTVDEVSDLFIQVGNSLEEVGRFKDALRFYRVLSDIEQYNTSELTEAVGKCYQEIGEYEKSIQAYNKVLSVNPDNINVKLALAETLFHTGKKEESRELLQQVKSKSKIHSSSRESSTEESVDATLNEPNTALLSNLKLFKRQKKQELAVGEKKEIEVKLVHDTEIKYKRLIKLASSIKDPTAITMWLQISSALVEAFCRVKSLFVKERMKNEAELVYNKRTLKMNLQERLEKLQELHLSTNSDLNLNPSLTLTETSFRGLLFDKWFNLFMQYCLLLALHGDFKEALQSIEITQGVVVFQKDPNKERIIRLVKLSISSITKDFEGTMLAIRDILNSHKVAPNAYKLFVLSLPSGRKASEVFISLNHQKYFLRQLKMWDSLRFNKHIPGQSKVDFDVAFDTSSLNPYLLVLYIQIMLSGRSYFSSLLYLAKAYSEFKHDPMICLLLGLAYLHRSMQRSSGDRHMFILQALTFFTEYKELRSKKGDPHVDQEIDFNFGRFFHQINLISIAVEYYEKVLQYENIEEKYDLKKEAAYNLYLIYNIHGNPHLAKLIMEKYLTI